MQPVTATDSPRPALDPGAVFVHRRRRGPCSVGSQRRLRCKILGGHKEVNGFRMSDVGFRMLKAAWHHSRFHYAKGFAPMKTLLLVDAHAAVRHPLARYLAEALPVPRVLEAGDNATIARWVETGH